RFVVRPLVRAIDQKPGQDVMDRIGEPLEPDLTGNGRPAAIGANNDPWRDRTVDTGAFEFDLGRKPRTDLDAIDAANERGPGGDSGLIEDVANPGMSQIQGALDSRDHLVHRHRKSAGNAGRKILPVRNRSNGVVTAGSLQQLENLEGC